MSDPIRPEIDDAYWFDWSKAHVDGSLEQRDAALGTLQKLVVWLWGIYTTFAAVGFALSERGLEPLTVFAISAASVLLIAVYWACVWGQMPVSVEFDPRSPTEIKEAHNAMISEKDQRLKIAMVLSLIAAGSVALALVAAGAGRTADAPSLAVSAESVPGADSTIVLALTARIGAETPATVDVVRDPAGDAPNSEPAQTFLSTEDGIVQASLRVTASGTYRVRITWEAGGVEHAMSTVVTRSGSG